MQITKIFTPEQARLASDFLATDQAFEDSPQWNETERQSLINTPFRCLTQPDTYHGWLIAEDDNVLGYIDLREHSLENDGYYTDWFVVHKDHRSQGIGTQALEMVEKFAQDMRARYILIETGDVDIYARTRKFYETHGYVQVGHIPEYYYANWGMCIYQKRFPQVH